MGNLFGRTRTKQDFYVTEHFDNGRRRFYREPCRAAFRHQIPRLPHRQSRQVDLCGESGQPERHRAGRELPFRAVRHLRLRAGARHFPQVPDRRRDPSGRRVARRPFDQGSL